MFAPGRAKDVQTKIYMCMFIQYKNQNSTQSRYFRMNRDCSLSTGNKHQSTHDGLISVSFSKWLDLLLINIIVLRMLNPYSIDYKKNSIYFHRKKNPITHTTTIRIDSYLNQSKKHAILSMHHLRYFNYFFFAHICKTI